MNRFFHLTVIENIKDVIVIVNSESLTMDRLFPVLSTVF